MVARPGVGAGLLSPQPAGIIPFQPFSGEISNASFDTIRIEFTILETVEFHYFTKSLRENSTHLSKDFACEFEILINAFISMIHSKNLAENFRCPTEDSFCSDFFIKTIHAKCDIF